MRAVNLAYACFICIFFSVSFSFAEEPINRSGFWGGVDIGVGELQQSYETFEEDDTNLYLGFTVGYTFNAQFRLGVELSGWNFEATDYEDPEKGEGLMQVFMVSRFYPSDKSNWYAKVGGGYAELWNNGSGQTDRNGWGLVVGGGYDYLISNKFAISPFASFHYGEADEFNYDAITVGIGLLLY